MRNIQENDTEARFSTKSIPEDDENYKEAVRLLNLLKNVLPIPSDFIAKDSILREFIGNSYFEK